MVEYMSHAMRKPVFCIYEKAKAQISCANVQAGQGLCFMLLGFSEHFPHEK